MNMENQVKESLKFKNLPIWGKIIVIGLVFISLCVILISVIFIFYVIVGFFETFDTDLNEEIIELNKDYMDEINRCLESCGVLEFAENYYYDTETKICSCFDINENLIEQSVIN